MATDTNFISALGAGSGIDIKALATSLVEVERAPRAAAIQDKIDAQDRRIAGYAAVSLALNNLKDAYAKLNDLREFTAGQASIDRTADLSATISGSVQPGDYSVVVNQLAAAQKSVSAGYTSGAASVNSGAAFTVTLTVGGVAQTPISVSAANATPAGIVEAINNADQGVTAAFVDTGDPTNPTRITLTGASGADGAFSLSAVDDATGLAVSDIDFSTTLVAAADAELTIDGLTITRSTNSVSDAVSGVVLNLLGVTPAGSTAKMSIAQDTTQVKENLLALVETYNQTMQDLDTLTGAVSDNPEDIYSGSLAGDSFVNTLRERLRGMMMDDSSTPSGSKTAFRDVGLDIDRYGVMSIDEDKLNTALSEDFADIAVLFSAGTDDQSTFGTAARGIAGDAIYSLEEILASRGVIAQQSSNATDLAKDYEEDLEQLETRLEALYQRYLKQFGVMESLVGQSNSMRDSLKSTFDGMMAVYTNN